MRGLSWFAVVRLGLVQTALGAIVVLTTSTLNRVMVVELALPAILPGLLVGLHYAVQMLRPRMGWGADMGGRRSPWILGGVAVLAAGGILASVATALMAEWVAPGVALSLAAFFVIGVGVAAAGTNLLALLAAETHPRRRPAAATLVWIMMIAGFAVTATVAGRLLDPYSPARLVAVCSGVSLAALLVAALALWRVEPARSARFDARPEPEGARQPFAAALAEVWREREARVFAIFVFVSMLAYSAQDLLLEPFAGEVFGRSIGQSTQLAGIQNGGTLLGMIAAAVAGSVFRASMRAWTVGGCLFSAAALVVLVGAGRALPLEATYLALGLGNGAFAAAAIASMMLLAGQGRTRREGTRMGLWGAAQAIAFGLGGVVGTAALDLSRLALGDAAAAYALVFVLIALMFAAAAWLGARISAAPLPPAPAFARHAPGD
ncbi:MAG: BCD family MFS transporter [Acetobacteraceae bacterium]|nr:BCD family MFS transporter [Acetobacteraceae bacterium]